MKFLLSIFSTAALLSLIHSPTYAAEESASAAAEPKAVAMGESAPEWKDLEGVDGKKHSSADIKDAKGVVVVFTCNHCPVAKAYEDRIVALASDYQDKGIELVAINVNNVEEDKLPAMKERAEAKDFKFAYLYDPSQEIGRAFGATVTPHAFLLDGEQNLVYAGAIDDNMEVEKVEKQYLRDAVDDVLAGSKPETESTKPVGCGIQYE
jgi:thiol-disulfide isomerase/thioredoxin